MNLEEGVNIALRRQALEYQCPDSLAYYQPIELVLWSLDKTKVTVNEFRHQMDKANISKARQMLIHWESQLSSNTPIKMQDHCMFLYDALRSSPPVQELKQSLSREDLQAMDMKFSKIYTTGSERQRQRNIMAQKIHQVAGVPSGGAQHKFMTLAFWDYCVRQITGSVDDIVEQIIQTTTSPGFNLSPLQLMQRANYICIRRLALGTGQQTPYVIAEDIRTAGQERNWYTVHLTDLRIRTLLQHYQWREVRGIYWKRGIQSVYFPSACLRDGKGGPEPTLPEMTFNIIGNQAALPLRPTSTSRSLSSSSSLQDITEQMTSKHLPIPPNQGIPTQRGLKKRVQGPLPYQQFQSSLVSPVTKHQRISSSPIDVKMAAIDKLAARSPVMTRALENGDPPPSDSPLSLPCPVSSPSTLHTSLWNMVNNRIRYKSQHNNSKEYQITPQESQSIQGKQAERILEILETFMKEIAAGAVSPVQWWAIQSILDVKNQVHSILCEQNTSVETTREYIGKWQQEFRANDTWIRATTARRQGQNLGGCQVNLHDILKFSLGKESDGWLTSAGVAGAIAAIRIPGDDHVDVVSSTSWGFYLSRQKHLPADFSDNSDNKFFILNPKGNHWVLAFACVSQLTIYYLDSMEKGGDRDQATSHIVRLFNRGDVRHPSLRGKKWRVDGKIKSERQANTYDCGIFVIENFRSVYTAIQRREHFSGSGGTFPPLTRPDGATRALVVEEMYRAAKRLG